MIGLELIVTTLAKGTFILVSMSSYAGLDSWLKCSHGNVETSAYGERSEIKNTT